jgi:uncharacterized protein HemY
MRQAYRSVILLTLMDEAAFTSTAMKNLTSEWESISQKVYNNTDLQSELVRKLSFARKFEPASK